MNNPGELHVIHHVRLKEASQKWVKGMFFETTVWKSLILVSIKTDIVIQQVYYSSDKQKPSDRKVRFLLQHAETKYNAASLFLVLISNDTSDRTLYILNKQSATETEPINN